MLRRFLAVTAIAASTAIAGAGPQTYANSVQTINAGIVVLDSSRNPANPLAYPEAAAPFPWYNLDANRSIKPVGWQFVNPHAPTRVTDAIRAAWNLPNNAVGTRLSKREAPYWQISLSQISDAALADYNILLVNPKYVGSNLNALEREKLRRFVDHGGILWVDTSGSQDTLLDPTNSAPVPFQLYTAPQGPSIADFTHPLLNRPFPIGASDVSLLNTGPGQTLSFGPIQASVLGNPTTAAYYSGVAGLSQGIRPISYIAGAAPTNTQTIGIAQQGAGYVVITTRGVSLKLNRATGTDYGGSAANPNTGFQGATPILDVDGLAASKFVVNMISLLTEFRQEGGGSTKTNGSAVSLEAPLLNRMQITGASFNTSGIAGSVVYKGMVIVSHTDNQGQGILTAYDVNPRADLDGDGNEDDGVPDDIGSGVDKIWEFPVANSSISPPVVAEVAGSGVPDQVLVVDAGGNLHGFDPLERDPMNGYRFVQGAHQEIYSNTSGGPLGAVAPPNPASSSGPVPLPPTVHDGLAFVPCVVSQSGGGGDRGCIWVMNLQTRCPMVTGTNRWYQGGGASPYQSAPFLASPTVGYIPILDNSGGVDRVVYAPFTTDNGQAPGFVSLWLGSRGEKPQSVDWTDTGLQVTTRASNGGGLPIYESNNPADPLNIKLTIQDDKGNPWSASQINGTFDGTPQDMGGGIILFPYKNGNPGTNVTDKLTVRVDYTVDWGNTSAGGGTMPAVERGRLQMPDKPTAATRSISGPIALTPGGTLYVAASGGGTAGLFGFREEGRGSFRCNFHYELYPKYNFTTQGNGVDRQPPVVEDYDDVAQTYAPMLRADMTGYSIVGGPCIQNGQVYLNVRAVKPLGFFSLPVTLVMAFQSEPEAAQIRVDDVPEGTVLVQADVVRSTSLPNADVPIVIPGANYTYDPESKTLRIENLMTIPRGQIQQCVSLSQRIYVRRPGRPDLAIDPDNQAGNARWSPLLWYAVLNGYDPKAPPIVTGDTLYIGASSAIRSFLSGNTSNPTFEGVLYAMSSQVSPNDDDLTFPPGRPWLKQVKMISGKSRWPYLTGLSSSNFIAEFTQRLGQTVLPGSTLVKNLVAGDGALVAMGDSGLYTYDRADFVVADEGRVAMFDPAGEPLWSTSSTFAAGPDGSTGSGISRPLVRPTRAYRLGQNEMLIVDPGANRVVRMDLAGTELRSLSGFQLDPKGAPTGYASNESLKLSNPRDALTFSEITNVANAPALSVGDGESANGYEYWNHYVVADAGNHRLVELIDRYAYDPTTQRILDPIRVAGVPQLGVLVWHSPANVSGKQFSYNSIQRVPVPIPNTNPQQTRYVYVAAVSNVLPTSESLGITAGASTESAGGNGGVIVFDPARPGPFVFNEVLIPQIPDNVLFNEATGQWNKTGVPAKVHPLTNIASVTATVEQVGSTVVGYLMISDANGVYETTFPINGSDTPPARLGVTWMMPNEVFRVMRRNPDGSPADTNAQNLRAVYARRLNRDQVVIVNSYLGKTRSGADFKGEVVQVDGTRDTTRFNDRNFRFDNSSITYELRSIVSTRGLVLPAFADRR